ncbi:MAG: hypothetical protein EXR59_04210 [Dehalococcoidia bacterium]|nr:hypothetical protein [Dehalococcoidia bacterium]
MEKFMTLILGMQVSDRDELGNVFLKMDERHHRFVLHPQGNNDIAYAGWEVKNEDELMAIASQLKAEGIEVERGTAANAQGRRVMGLIKLKDPSGIPTEVYYGPMLNYGNNFKSPREISGFVTGEMGIGHIVISADNFEKSLQFYKDLLGFRVTNLSGTPGEGFRMAFMHCNPRHHSLGIQMARVPSQGSGPYGLMPARRLQHVMIQAGNIDDVGSTNYLCLEKGVPFAKTFGRHGNDHMLSFYIWTPAGFGLEYGCGGRQVDDSTWIVTPPENDPWGHLQASPPVNSTYKLNYESKEKQFVSRRT